MRTKSWWDYDKEEFVVTVERDTESELTDDDRRDILKLLDSEGYDIQFIPRWAEREQIMLLEDIDTDLPERRAYPCQVTMGPGMRVRAAVIPETKSVIVRSFKRIFRLDGEMMRTMPSLSLWKNPVEMEKQLSALTKTGKDGESEGTSSK